MSKKELARDKAIRVIKSCVDEEQLRVSSKYIIQHYRLFKDDNIYYELLRLDVAQRIVIRNNQSIGSYI